MREFLFRGKDTFGDWQYGAISKYSEGFVVIVPPLSFNKQVEPESVGQYTGLTDKNGTKIFEGDIVKLFLDDGIETGVIRYSENACRFMFYENNIMGYGFDNTCTFEIIGNITDNPELLEVNANA